MWSLALKQAAAHRLRFVLTMLAVVIGVTFVSGTLVLTDTSQKLFDDKFAGRNAGSDLTVRTEVAFDEAMGVEVEHDPVPAALLDRVRGTAGVRAAAGVVSGRAALVVDGTEAGHTGRQLLMSWADDPFGGFRLAAGRLPEQADDVVLDRATARRAGVALGSEVTLQAGRVG